MTKLSLSLSASKSMLCPALGNPSHVKNGVVVPKVLIVGTVDSFDVVGNHEEGLLPEIRYVTGPDPVAPMVKLTLLALAYSSVTRERPSVPGVFEPGVALLNEPLPIPAEE